MFLILPGLIMLPSIAPYFSISDFSQIIERIFSPPIRDDISKIYFTSPNKLRLNKSTLSKDSVVIVNDVKDIAAMVLF